MTVSNGTQQLRLPGIFQSIMYWVAFLRGSPANDAHLAPAPAAVCPETEGALQARSLHKRLSNSSSNNTTTTPAASTSDDNAKPDFTSSHRARPTLPPITTSQHQLLPAEFRYPSALSVPLRRLTHINFTCIRLHYQPIATALVHSEHPPRAHSSRLGWLATDVHRQPDKVPTNTLRDSLA